MDACTTSHLANDSLSRSHSRQCPVLDDKTPRKSIFKGIKIALWIEVIDIIQTKQAFEIPNMLIIYYLYSVSLMNQLILGITSITCTHTYSWWWSDRTYVKNPEGLCNSFFRPRALELMNQHFRVRMGRDGAKLQGKDPEAGTTKELLWMIGGLTSTMRMWFQKYGQIYSCLSTMSELAEKQ